MTGTLIAPVIPSSAAARPARAPAAARTLPPRSCVPIPAALRHRCGLLPEDPVLLTAVPAEDTLTAYSLAEGVHHARHQLPQPARQGASPRTRLNPPARLQD